MGCSNSVEEQVFLAKLERLELQVKKEKELKKLAEIEGKPIESMNQYKGFDTKTENKKRMKTTPNERYLDTYTTKEKSRKKNGSEKKSKKAKDSDEKSKKTKRAFSEGVTKKKKKKK